MRHRPEFMRAALSGDPASRIVPTMSADPAGHPPAPETAIPPAAAGPLARFKRPAAQPEAAPPAPAVALEPQTPAAVPPQETRPPRGGDQRPKSLRQKHREEDAQV